MKKKIQFMIPNAKDAFNMEQLFWTFTEIPLMVMLPKIPDQVAPPEVETWVQFAEPMKRSS